MQQWSIIYFEQVVATGRQNFRNVLNVVSSINFDCSFHNYSHTNLMFRLQIFNGHQHAIVAAFITRGRVLLTQNTTAKSW